MLVKPGGYLVIGTDNFECRAVRMMGAGFPKWIPHQHISLFGPNGLRQLAAADRAFTIHSESAYTPWEYWARIVVQRITGGRRGCYRYALGQDLDSEETRGFAFFALRKRFNGLWPRVSRAASLEAGMMYLVLRKQ